MKNLITFLIILILFGLPEYMLAQTVKEKNVPCFIYHRFGDKRYPSTNTSLEDFEAHLRYLKQNNYKVLTLGEALEILEGDVTSLVKTVVLTVDDGFASFYEEGLPLLEKYDFKATLFVNTGMIGAGDYMSWGQILEAKTRGIEIGNHSHSHQHFVEEDLSTFAEDFKLSQAILKEKLGERVDIYAYPYGEYTIEMKKFLKDHNVEAAVAQNSGVMSSFSDPLALPRFPMVGIYGNPEQFRTKAKMRALAVEQLEYTSHLIDSEVPPVLKLKLLQNQAINKSSLNCFVSGSNNCDLELSGNEITIRSGSALRNRRTLYTLTAQSMINPEIWHWYSFLWINTNKAE